VFLDDGRAVVPQRESRPGRDVSRIDGDEFVLRESESNNSDCMEIATVRVIPVEP
jgi:hypothetical protein